jgi:pyruvate kinase
MKRATHRADIERMTPSAPAVEHVATQAKLVERLMPDTRRPVRLPLTKIIATVGPATSDRTVIARLIETGVSVFRLNFSHGTPAEHEARLADIREVSQELGRPIAVLGDLPGPKIRVGPVDGGILLSEGFIVRLAPKPIPAQQIEPGLVRLGCTFDKLAQEVQPGHRVLIDDGAIRTIVTAARDGEIECTVTVGGLVTSGKGINLPDSDLSLAAMTPRDWEHVDFALQHELDFLALSFVSGPEDVRMLADGIRERCVRLKKPQLRLPIVAKIERPRAVARCEEIIDAADAIMIARGDLGVEMDLARLPIVQKKLVAAAQAYGKPCIVATQMLQSMIESATPTRAEVTDVAGAIFEAVDAVMLSGETAVGKHPQLVVEMMRRIANETEAHLATTGYSESPPSELMKSHYRTAALAHGVWTVARDLAAAFVVVWSQQGGGARYLSQNNFHIPIIAVSTDDRALRQMQLLRGVIPVCMLQPENVAHFIVMTDEYLLATEWANEGDPCVIVAGEPIGISGVTNSLIIHRVGSRTH